MRKEEMRFEMELSVEELKMILRVVKEWLDMTSLILNKIEEEVKK